MIKHQQLNSQPDQTNNGISLSYSDIVLSILPTLICFKLYKSHIHLVHISVSYVYKLHTDNHNNQQLFQKLNNKHPKKWEQLDNQGTFGPSQTRLL